MSRIDPIVRASCDRLDGVEDGLIQNPAACNFVPERDLPRCGPGGVGEGCFTDAQIQTVSTLVTAVTDESGAVIQPGLSVSELQYAFRVNSPPNDRTADQPWPEAAFSGSSYALGDAIIRVYAHGGDPGFRVRSVVDFATGGLGPITGFRVVAPAREVATVRAPLEAGIGDDAAQLGPFIAQDRKLLIWQNMSDGLVTPFNTTNYYARLAQRHGGYEALQNNVRLFMLPGTPHCSMGGVGPNSFDALAALEDWVENGIAPDSLRASLYQARGPVLNFAAPPSRTMPLCSFPAMARYRGTGDVNDAANWDCPAGDNSMLQVGESGRQAGVAP
jgi:feruloyl esterase